MYPRAITNITKERSVIETGSRDASKFDRNEKLRRILHETGHLYRRFDRDRRRNEIRASRRYNDNKIRAGK